MPLISTSIPNMVGGVSQQPPAQRLPNQCESQENAMPLLVGGLMKRPPSNHMGEVTAHDGSSLDLTDTFNHFVTRDATEKFFVTLTGNNNEVHVTGIDGTAHKVYSDLGSSSYLTSVTPAAVATVEFTGAAVVDQTIQLISTDGTTRTYTAKAATSESDGEFINTDKNAAATALKSCIEHASGHGSKLVVLDSGTGTLTITQSTGGTSGNTAVTSSLSNVTVVQFNGGAAATVPQSDFRAVTIADVTYLLNRSVETKISETLSADPTPREGMVWLKTSGQGVKFTAKVTPTGESESSVSVSHGPSPESLGVQATAPGIAIYHDQGASSTAASVRVHETYIELVVTGGTNAGTANVTFGDSGRDTLTELAEYINDTLDMGAGAGSSGFQVSLEGQGTLASGSLKTTPALVSCYGTGSTQTLVSEADPNIFAYPPNAPGTTAIADSLAQGTAIDDCTVTSGGLTGLSGFTATSSGSVLFVSHDTKDFQLTVEDSLGQQAHAIIKDSVQSFSDLPPIAKNGMLILVKGDPESQVDDYYVKFETNNGETYGNGVWVENIGPSLKYVWDYDTLPHILIRQSDGTFLVKRGDGVTPTTGVPVGADYSLFKFTPREVGSDLTNPVPSFEGSSIRDISFFKNRLAFVSGEGCIFSEAGEYFNFFRTTVTQLLDTAPIDIAAGGTEINKIDSAIPFSNRLILFSTRTQFSVQGETILSPSTASITQVTNFDVVTTIPPLSAGNSLYFPFVRGDYSGIREYYKTQETDINFDAVEVTAHVPKYVKGVVQNMTVSTHEDILAVVGRAKNTDGTFAPTQDVYIYKFFKAERGNVQSAWGKFSFENASIIAINFVEQSLYVVLKRGSKTFLEKIDLQNGLVDSDVDYVTHLDRRVLIEGGSISGNTLTLPYDIVSGDTVEVVSAYSSVGGEGEVMTIESQTSNTVTLSEDVVSGEKFWVGIPYTMKYEVTRPFLKLPGGDGRPRIVPTGRHQIRYMTLVYDSTASFVVRVTPLIGGDDGTPVDYPFTGRFLSAGAFLGSIPKETGDFRFPVFAQSDSVRIEILNDTPFPSNLQSAEFEASYSSRIAQRH